MHVAVTENPPPYHTTCSPPLHPAHCTVYVANRVHMYEWHINHAEFNEHASHPCPGPLERGVQLPPTPHPPLHCVLKCGFNRTFPGNEDATLK